MVVADSASGFATHFLTNLKSDYPVFSCFPILDSSSDCLQYNISLWFSYAYTDAQNTNSAADANFVAAIEDGDPLINVPKNQVSVLLAKGTSVSNMPLRIGTGLLYVDERLGQTATDFYLPSYTTVRAFVEIEPLENLTIKAEVSNLFDKEHYTNSFADVWVQPGTPQRARVTASYQF